MTASFPASVKTFTTKQDYVDTVLASDINSPQEEIVAIQNVLLGNTEAKIRIGGTTIAGATVGVVGFEDVAHLVLRGYSTQANPILVIQNSDTATALRFVNNPADNNTYLDLRTTAASKQASIVLYDDDTGKWQFGKDSSNNFFIYDSAGTANVITITTKGNVAINSATDLGKELLTLQQDDADKAFIDFDGTSAASAANNISTWTSGNTIQGFYKIEVEGVERWTPYYDAPTS